MLLQEGHLVVYMSKKLGGPELYYSASDMEMMAVIYALREWLCYLEGQPFTIITDHQPNTFLDKATKTHALKRRARWLHESGAFDHVWQYKPGKQNIEDPISRTPQKVWFVCRIFESLTRVYRVGVWFGFVRFALLLAVGFCWVDRCFYFRPRVLLGLLCLLRATLWSAKRAGTAFAQAGWFLWSGHHSLSSGTASLSCSTAESRTLGSACHVERPQPHLLVSLRSIRRSRAIHAALS